MQATILMLGWMLLAGQPLWADNISSTSQPNQAIFVSVDGDVEVILDNGKKTIAAKKDLTVIEGARIIAKTDSSAVLRLFDGSELTVSPQTEFALTKMQKPSAQDKAFKFDLFIGKLEAVVKALTTANSSFEIEAGGVVCGVRGTRFWMECDPRIREVLLNVDEGKVAVQQKGHPTQLVKAGEHRIFNDLHMTAPKGTTPQELPSEVGSAPVSAGTSTSPLNNPALKSMVHNSQEVNQTNKNNLVHTIQQNSNLNLHVGSGETAP